MNNEHKHRSQGLLSVWLRGILVITVAVSAIFMAVMVYYRTKDIMDAADTRLLIAAEMSREMVGTDFHDRLDSPSSLSLEEFDAIVARNDDLCRRLGLQYLWSVLQLGEEHLVFTTATHSDIYDSSSPCAAFFEVHSDPGAFAPALTLTMKPAFSSFRNEWGRGRMVLIPRKDAQGRTYIFGASIQLTQYNALVFQSLLTGMFVFGVVICCAYLLALVYTRRLVASIESLTLAADRMASGDLEAGLPSANIREIQSLSYSFDRMRQDLKLQIAALRDNKELLSATLRSIGDGVIVCNVSGIVISLNSAAERLTGWNHPEAAGLPVEEVFRIINTKTRESAENPIKQALSKGVTVGLANHTALISRDGTEYQIADSCAPIRDESDKIMGVVLVFRDVTEEYRQREQLADERRRLNYILEVTRTSINIVDSHYNLRYVDSRWQNIYGDPKGKKCYDYFKKQQIPCTNCGIPQAFETKAPVVLEQIMPLEDNRVVEVHTIPFQDAGGEWLVAEFKIDINERKKAEEKLRESEEKFRNMANQAPIMISVTDESGKITFLNKTWLDFRGKTLEEESEQAWVQALHPEDCNQTVAVKENAMRQGEGYSLEYRIQDRHGNYHWLLDTSTPIFDSNGKPKGFIGSAINITERRRVEEELINSRWRLGNIIRGTNVGTWEWNIQTGEAIFNDRWAEIIGYTLAELEPISIETWLKYAHPDDLNISNDLIQRHFNRELDYYECESRMQHKDGRWIWVLDRGCVSAWTDDAKPLLMSGTHQDITERKCAEETLKKSQARLQQILSTTPDGFLMVDSSERIHKVNDAFCAMLGYNESELLKLRIQDIEYQETPEETRQHIEAIQRQGYDRFETLHRKKDDSAVDVEISVSLLPGEETYLVAFVRDITERKRAEKEILQAKEAAESANKVKSEFLANMSHEIRTPMNAVIGLSRLMLENPLNHEQRDSLTKIHSSSKMLLGIINDILDYSKIEAGKLELDLHPFLLDDLLEQMRALFNDAVEAKNLELYFRVAPDLPSGYRGDSLRLGQILINIIGNAVKFTDKGYVELNISRTGGDESNAILRFEINDTGIGLCEVEANKLFKAFSQGDTSTTRKYGGTGLGLVISSSLVQAMGGELKVSSIPGQGSSFFFEILLPILPQTTDRINIQIGKKILIADDQPLARIVLRNIIGNHQAKIVEVSSGREAVDAVIQADNNGEPFDYILMDWKMPGELDGVAAIKAICQMRENGTIGCNEMPILIISAYRKEEIPAKDVKIDAFLQKPVTAAQLQTALLEASAEGAADTLFSRDQIAIPSFIGSVILLAEDNLINQDVAMRWLAKTGAEVIIADNGQKAVEKTLERRFDMVLMDIQMPVMDGYAAAAAIKQQFPHLPIIALSAAVMEADKQKAYQSGMSGHIAKPIDERELYHTLTLYLKTNYNTAAQQIISAPDETYQPDTYNPKPESRNNPLIETLPLLEGFDTAQGLRSADRDPIFYAQLLKRFRIELNGNLGTIPQTIRNGDITEGQSLAHSLKGLAGIVGANKLALAAEQLELACKQNSPINEKLLELIESLTQQAITELNKLPDDNSEKISSAPDISVEIGITSVKQLIQALTDSEIPDDAIIATALQYIETQLNPETAAELKAYIESFDYDQALERLTLVSDILNGI